MQQDVILELLQSSRRLQPHLPSQVAPKIPKGTQRLDLAATAIQGQHQLGPRPLPQRIHAHRGLQLGDQLGVTTQSQRQLDPILDRGHPQALQAGGLGPGEVLVGELGQRRASPQRQSVVEQLQRPRKVTGRGSPAGVGQLLGETTGIQPVRVDPQQVAGGHCQQGPLPVARRPARLDHRPKAIDVFGERAGRVLGRVVAPKNLHQPVDRHHHIGSHQQRSQQQPLLGRPDGHGPTLDDHLQGTKNPECRRAGATHLSRPSPRPWPEARRLSLAAAKQPRTSREHRGPSSAPSYPPPGTAAAGRFTSARHGLRRRQPQLNPGSKGTVMRFRQAPNRTFRSRMSRASRALVAAMGLVSIAVAATPTAAQARPDHPAADWTEHHPAHSPSARLAPTAYDPANGTVVLFGSPNFPDNGVFLDDTWTWNGHNWTQRHPKHHPPGRGLPGLAYDPAHHNVVLFGGVTGTPQNPNVQDDTWTWDGTDWTEQHPTDSPPGRFALKLVTDPATHGLLLFGGNGPGFAILSDTWTWDGTDWTEQHPVTTPDPNSSMASDPATHTVVAFGGGSEFSLL